MDILWTPDFYGRCDFGVNLNRDFAREMIEAKVSNEKQIMMNDVANGKLKELGKTWLNPYRFHENSCFLSQIYLGENGVWLATDRQNIESLLVESKLEKAIEYSSHNVDRPAQACTLMVLFGTWVEYADAFKEA